MSRGVALVDEVELVEQLHVCRFQIRPSHTVEFDQIEQLIGIFRHARRGPKNTRPLLNHPGKKGRYLKVLRYAPRKHDATGS